jgi:hypothetical protein
MRHRLVPISAWAAGLLLLSACGDTVVTAARLEDSIGPTYAALYERYVQLKGHPLPPGTAQASADCHRSDSRAGDQGAGDDWSCRLLLQVGSPVDAVTYEVNAKADGCYTADGPPTVVGGRTLHTATGKDVVNPLFAFDGCID